MPPLTTTETDNIDKPFHVHLTGFGPFRDVKLNPSWQVVSQLHNTTITSAPSPLQPPRSPSCPACALPILASPPAATSPPVTTPSRPARPLRLTTSEGPVTYTDVTRLVPTIHAPPSGDRPPDLIVHVGVGLAGTLTLEQRGRRWGYEAEDAEGKFCGIGEGGMRGAAAEECGKVVETGAEGDEEVRTVVRGEVVQDWVRDRGLERLVISEDAGLYPCEFITFNSTATAKHNARSLDLPEIPVQFIHVPAIDEPYTLAELTQSIRLIVWAIVNEGGLLVQ